jgi:hypothetical protein
MRRKTRNPSQRLRLAVEALPRRTRLAMLRGMRDNEVIAGAYVDHRSGGICPMLAAHRNGGRTSLGSFARAWDRFTGARRPRLATLREVRALTSYLELSLLREEQEESSVASLAERIRSEREDLLRSERRADATASEEEVGGSGGTSARPRSIGDAGERHRVRELGRRFRWSWLLPSRRYDLYAERLAAAEEQVSEQHAEATLGKRPVPHP